MPPKDDASVANSDTCFFFFFSYFFSSLGLVQLVDAGSLIAELRLARDEAAEAAEAVQER